jgi:DNA-binding LacI/PurR family transcriptional regulator
MPGAAAICGADPARRPRPILALRQAAKWKSLGSVSRRADTIVFARTRRRDARIEYLSEVGFPFTTLGRSLSAGTAYSSLDLDFVRVGEQSVARLAARGHRRIAVVGPTPELNFAHLFRRGYRQGLKGARLAFDPALLATAEVNEVGGYAAVLALVKAPHPPTTILFNNDALALGGCRALGEFGLQPGSRCRGHRHCRQPALQRLFADSA